MNKHFNKPPLRLFTLQPQLAEYFHLENAISLSDQAIIALIKSNRRWIYERFHSLKIERKDLVIILQDHPELLLKMKCRNYSFCDNITSFVAADFFDFDQTGLDSVCNVAYCYLEKRKESPQGAYNNATDKMPVEEFMLTSTLDPVNAKRYLLKKIGNWQFFDDLFELDPEAIYRFLPETEVAVLWCIAADEKVGIKYLDQIENIADIADKNGNTLLHAALLRAVFTDFENIYEPGSPCRQYYDYLVARGCDPDKKIKKEFPVTIFLLLSVKNFNNLRRL